MCLGSSCRACFACFVSFRKWTISIMHEVSPSGDGLKSSHVTLGRMLFAGFEVLRRFRSAVDKKPMWAQTPKRLTEAPRFNLLQHGAAHHPTPFGNPLFLRGIEISEIWRHLLCGATSLALPQPRRTADFGAFKDWSLGHMA